MNFFSNMLDIFKAWLEIHRKTRMCFIVGGIVAIITICISFVTVFGKFGGMNSVLKSVLSTAVVYFGTTFSISGFSIMYNINSGYIEGETSDQYVWMFIGLIGVAMWVVLGAYFYIQLGKIV